MKFLTDQDVYASTIRFLSGLGHEVVTAAQLGMSKTEDAIAFEGLRQDQDRRLPAYFSFSFFNISACTRATSHI